MKLTSVTRMCTSSILKMSVVLYTWVIRRECFITNLCITDPNSLSCQKLMELVRLICSKAVEHVQYSGPAAHLCFSIIEVGKHFSCYINIECF